MTKTIKQIGLFVLAFVLILATALVFTACGKNEQQKQKFTVTFYVSQSDGTNAVYTTAQVKDGNRVTKPADPTFDVATKVFTAWYKDSEFTQVWNFAVDQVTKNTDLFAGFREITTYPSQIQMANEPCTSKITWTQLALTEGNYTVTITDKDGVQTQIAGTTSFDEENYVVTFTPTTVPQGGIYGVRVTDSEETTSAVANNQKFCGAGTQTNPYLVYSSLDFNKIRTANVAENVYFNLAADITIETFREEQKDFTFNGNLLGNGYTITLANASAAPIFKIGENGTVSTVTIAGSISSENDSVGGLADFNYGTVSKVRIIANVTSTSGRVGSVGLANALNNDAEDGTRGIAGGIVGTNFGLVSNCKILTTTSSDGVVKAKIGGGCIVGLNETTGIVEKCTSEGCLGAWNSTEVGKSLSNYSYSGGVVGINKGMVKECSLEGSGKVLAQRYADETSIVAGTNNTVIGGIVGYNMQNATVSKCLYSGIRVHGDENVGGIVGLNAGTVEFCMSEGLAHSSTGISYVGGRDYVGGLVGKMELGNNDQPLGVVKNSFSTVNVYAYGTNAKAWSISEFANDCLYLEANPTEKEETAALTDPTGLNCAVLTATKNSDGNMVVASSFVTALNGTTDNFVYDNSDAVKTIKLNITKEPELHTTLRLFNGTTEKDPIEIYETGQVITLPEQGYRLDGWALENGGEIVFAPSTVFDYYKLVNNNITALYAVYSEIPVAEEDLVIYVYEASKAEGGTEYFNKETANKIVNKFIELNGLESVNVRVEFYRGSVGNGGLSDIIKSEYVDVVFGIRANETFSNINKKDMSLTNLNAPESNLNLTEADIKGGGSMRRAALLTEREWAIKFFSYVTGLSATTAQVTFVVDETSTTGTVNEALSQTINAPTVTAPENQTFVGWATTQDATEAQIAATVTKVAYSHVATLLNEQNQVTLYPVFANIVYDMAVAIMTNNSVTEAEVTELLTLFKASNASFANLQIKTYVCAGNVAPSVDAIQTAGDVDIVIGSGGNIDSTAGTQSGVTLTISNKAALDYTLNIDKDNDPSTKAYSKTGRQAALINLENNFAKALYLFACVNLSEVTFVENTTTQTTVLVSDKKTTNAPTVTAPAGQVFAGWSLTENGDVLIAGGAEIAWATISSNVSNKALTLYAVFQDE